MNEDLFELDWNCKIVLSSMMSQESVKLHSATVCCMYADPTIEACLGLDYIPSVLPDSDSLTRAPLQ